MKWLFSFFNIALNLFRPQSVLTKDLISDLLVLTWNPIILHWTWNFLVLTWDLNCRALTNQTEALNVASPQSAVVFQRLCAATWWLNICLWQISREADKSVNAPPTVNIVRVNRDRLSSGWSGGLIIFVNINTDETEFMSDSTDTATCLWWMNMIYTFEKTNSATGVKHMLH